jgi:aminoglycoside/choline kinase family phosphotransferase
MTGKYHGTPNAMALGGIDLERLETLVRQVGTVSSITEMLGGASTRRYFRVELDKGKVSSLVAMFVPEGAKPEEITKQNTHARWPFLEVRDLLASASVDVPALYAEDQEHGWLLIEDLGEDTLANYLLRQDDARERLYQRAVLDLAKAQEALRTLPADSVVRSRAFDADLLRWEIDHFREWGLEARGHVLSEKRRAEFDAIAGRLAERIASWPRGFVHRDYQSRNLMVRGPVRENEEALCWIDFQDALLGPRVYDLVALLNDSYQTFDRAFVERRLDEYARVTAPVESGGPTLLKQFDYVTVQRKLKDAGRFVFIDKQKHNAAFLRFVTPTMRKITQSLDRLTEDPDMKALRALLIEALPHELG